MAAKSGKATEPVASTEVATTTKPLSLAGQTFGEMAGYTKDDVRGKEGITTEELRLPFLSLAQKTSKALDPTEDAHIDGLEFGQMYNSETQEVYGNEPLTFIPLKMNKRAHLLTDDNKIGDEVDWNDPRVIPPWKPGSKVTDVEDLEGIRIIDWVVLLTTSDGQMPAVISFKGKSFPAGERLCTFISMVKGPAFSAQYKIASVLDSNAKGKFAKFNVLAAGKPTADEAAFAESMYENIKDQKIAGDNTPVETEAAAGEPAGDAKPKGDVPF